MEEYSEPVLVCLHAGFTLHFDKNGKAHVTSVRPQYVGAWGFNAELLRRQALGMSWPDHELIYMLNTGGYDYSQNTPPVSWFTPHRISVYKHWNTFAVNMRKEIEAEWMRGTWSHPPTVPFRIVPGATIPKPRRADQYRITWNASVPGPHLPESLIGNGAGLLLPSTANAAVELPPYLAIAWLSMQRVCHKLHLPATAARENNGALMVRGWNFAHWFKCYASQTWSFGKRAFIFNSNSISTCECRWAA